MFVPTVPFVPHTTIINKTIVYSDTVLPLKDTGNNLKVTSISDVSESSLEKCLKTIFESNSNIIFNTIQYSKNEKKVYFYTNEDITTKAYEESKFTYYKPITSKTEILEEIKRVLVANKNNDDNCISLYDIAKLLKGKDQKYNSILEKYQILLNNIVRSKLSNYSRITIYNFDYENKILRIGYSSYFGGDYAEIQFTKQNGDLCIIKSESCHTEEIFKVLSLELSNLYDELIKYIDYLNYKKASYNIKASNSSFIIDISKYGASISEKKYNPDFELSSPADDDDYSIDCNSNNVISAIKGNEDEIFKRIFVKIEDCPKWSQTMLYELKEKQLKKQQSKQKRLELTRKIFPFLKK